MSTVRLDAIPAHYLAAGAETGFNPKPFERLCVVLLGASKTGKSTLAAGLPGYAYFDMEMGAHSIVGMQATRFKCPVFQQKDLTSIQKAEHCTSIMNLAGLLLKDAKEGNRHFNSVILDSMEVLQSLVVEDMSKSEGSDIRDANNMGKNWSRIAEKICQFPVALQNNGYGWWAITHSKLVEDGSKLRPGVTPTTYQTLTAYADYMLRIEKKPDNTMVDGKPVKSFKHILYIEPSPKVVDDFAQGGRITLPPKLELPRIGGLQYLKEVYEKAVAEERLAHEKFIAALDKAK